MFPELRVVLTPEPGELSREVVNGHLYLTVARERDGDYVELRHRDVAGTGLRDDAVFALAMSLLRQRTARADLRMVHAQPGLEVLVSPDGLAASRITLLPDLVGPRATGGLVVAVPTAEHLLYVPLRSASALDAVHVLASAMSRALSKVDEPLSDQLFWYDGARWIPLTVIRDRDLITVLPPPSFVGIMNRLAAMDLVTVVGEA